MELLIEWKITWHVWNMACFTMVTKKRNLAHGHYRKLTQQCNSSVLILKSIHRHVSLYIRVNCYYVFELYLPYTPTFWVPTLKIYLPYTSGLGLDLLRGHCNVHYPPSLTPHCSSFLLGLGLGLFLVVLQVNSHLIDASDIFDDTYNNGISFYDN